MEEKHIIAEVKRLAEVLQGCQAFGENFRTNQNFQMNAGSPLSQEAESVEKKYLVQALEVCVACHVVAEDHLNGMAHLFGPPPITVFTQQVAMRSAIEACARANYLLDPEIDARARVALYLNVKADDLVRSLKMMRAANEKERVQATQEALDSLWLEAEDLGYSIQVDNKGRKVAVEKALLNATDQISRLLQDLGKEFGLLTYQHYSAVAHGTLAGVLASFDVQEGENEDRKKGAAQVTAQDIAVQFTIAALAWTISFDRMVHMAGWNVPDWHGWRDHVVDAVNKTWARPTP